MVLFFGDAAYAIDWTRVRNGVAGNPPLVFRNAGAFTQAPIYTFGNVSRTISIRGPGQANTDFSMFKSYTVRERLKAQFRFEVFNLTNTPLFNGLNATYGSSSFGQINNQANYPRIVQLGVRISY